MSKIVTDLVIQTSGAAAEAIAQHYDALLRDKPRDVSADAICQALDHGYDSDLDERTSGAQTTGFSHATTSEIFSRRLEPILGRSRRGLSTHIFGGDEDQGLYSLFGRPKPDGRYTGPRRSRASALVQRYIRDCRRYRQAEKATTTTEASRLVLVTVPSPLFVAKQLLGDPNSAGSQTYAAAALREWVREELEVATDQPIDLSFPAISEALTLINNRWKTSKPIVADLRNNGATVLFLCNLLALEGMAAMRVEIDLLTKALPDGASSKGDLDQCDAKLRQLWLGTSPGQSEFIINPDFVELPSASVILNMIDSLPVPFEGGDTIFQGGLRLSADKSLVAAISGEFGTGKTLFGLALAAALAPLGCRTLFLSCEESAVDIQSRLIESAPRSLFRAKPLFKTLDENDFRLKQFEQHGSGGGLSWFVARQLRLEDASASGDVDPASGLADLLKTAIDEAEIFKPWSEGPNAELPSFARPVVIIDGVHQLFDNPDSYYGFDSSLRKLVETCRSLGAIFLFSFSRDWEELRKMEYLCDLIIEVERSGHDSPADKPARTFQLLKARRQPARTGAHLFHIKGDAGFRFKPSVDARVQELKSQLWSAPSEQEQIYLLDEPPKAFRQAGSGGITGNTLSISNHSQILLIGQGSAGKAGFGLYLLHRRWFDTVMTQDHRQLHLPMDRRATNLPEGSSTRKLTTLRAAQLLVRADPTYLETRVLVISFLYQQNYYDELTLRLAAKRRGKVDRGDPATYAQIDDLAPFEFAPLPDKLWTDTISLYPGMLSVEDFIAKVDKRLAAAERSGVPYTGVLVDGLHNVFVQFPALERESSFWGMFYNILRRRRVTVVTTHTEFDINAHPDSQTSDDHRQGHSIAYDFEQAQRKIAPLLSVLVSGADYLFDLSPSYETRSLMYRLTPRAALGGNINGLSYSWDKSNLRLEALAAFPLEPRRPPVDARQDSTTMFAKTLIELIRKISAT